MNKKESSKPLTLNGLIKYNHEVLFPYLKETFAGKKEFNELKGEFKDFKSEMTDFKSEMTDFKSEMTDFKDESLTNQDKILKKLDTLLDEKDVGKYQREKEKRLLAIHNNALKEHQILSPKEIVEIEKLEIF